MTMYQWVQLQGNVYNCVRRWFVGSWVCELFASMGLLVRGFVGLWLCLFWGLFVFVF